jgi:hypothetical protein
MRAARLRERRACRVSFPRRPRMRDSVICAFSRRGGCGATLATRLREHRHWLQRQSRTHLWCSVPTAMAQPPPQGRTAATPAGRKPAWQHRFRGRRRHGAVCDADPAHQIREAAPCGAV